jgi:hypothetical protein
MWYATLVGEKECFECLKNNFSDYIKFKYGNYIIEYPKFNSCTTHGEVFRYARKFLKTLLAIFKVNDVHCQANINTVTLKPY